MTTQADAAMLKAASDCILFLASPHMCKKGSNCEFRHSEQARLNPRECRYWMLRTCNAGAACPFRHPPLSDSERAQLASDAAASQSRVPCYYFASGSCAKGDTCHFSHAAPPDARGTHLVVIKGGENDKQGPGPMAVLHSTNGVRPVTAGDAKGVPAGRAPVRAQVTGAVSETHGRLAAAGLRDLRRNGTVVVDGGEEGFDVLVTNPKEEGVREEGQRKGEGGRVANERQIRTADLRNMLKRQRGVEMGVAGGGVTGADGASVGGVRRGHGEGVTGRRLVQQFLGMNGRRVGGSAPGQSSILGDRGRLSSVTTRASEAVPPGRSGVAMREGREGAGGGAAAPPRGRLQGRSADADTSAPKSLSEILAERRKGGEDAGIAGKSHSLSAKVQPAKVRPAIVLPAKVLPVKVLLAKAIQRAVVMGGEGSSLPGGVGSRKGVVPVPPHMRDGSRVRQPVVSASGGGAGPVGFEKPKSLEEILREKRKGKDLGEKVGEVGELMLKKRGVGDRQRVWAGPGGGVGMGEARDAKGEDQDPVPPKRRRGEVDIVASEAGKVGGTREPGVGGSSSAPLLSNNSVQQPHVQARQWENSGVESGVTLGLEREGGLGKEKGARAEEEEEEEEEKEVEEKGAGESSKEKFVNIGDEDLGGVGSIGSENYEDLEDDDDLAKELGGFFS